MVWIMVCQKCGSEHILTIYAHSRDCNDISIDGLEHKGYLPYIDDICGGDDVDIKICMSCGQVQGTFPKVDNALSAVREVMGLEEDDDYDSEF